MYNLSKIHNFPFKAFSDRDFVQGKFAQRKISLSHNTLLAMQPTHAKTYVHHNVCTASTTRKLPIHEAYIDTI